METVFENTSAGRGALRRAMKRRRLYINNRSYTHRAALDLLAYKRGSISFKIVGQDDHALKLAIVHLD